MCLLLKEAAASPFARRTLEPTRQQLRQEVSRCLPCSESDNETINRLKSAAQAAVATVQENSTLIAIAIAVLLALFVLPRVIPQLPRVFIALIPLGARQALTQIPALMARLRAQQAANDAFFKLAAGL